MAINGDILRTGNRCKQKVGIFSSGHIIIARCFLL